MKNLRYRHLGESAQLLEQLIFELHFPFLALEFLLSAFHVLRLLLEHVSLRQPFL